MGAVLGSSSHSATNAAADVPVHDDSSRTENVDIKKSALQSLKTAPGVLLDRLERCPLASEFTSDLPVLAETPIVPDSRVDEPLSRPPLARSRSRRVLARALSHCSVSRTSKNRKTLGQLLLQNARRLSLPRRRCVENGMPPAKRRRHIRLGPAQLTDKPGRQSDDDTDGEAFVCPSHIKALLRLLLTESRDKLHELDFAFEGVHLRLPAASDVRGDTRSFTISRCVAMHFCGGIDPSSCMILQSGKLTLLARGSRFLMVRANGGWILTVDSRAFFNFTLKKWQPMGLVRGAYAPVQELLYVAFAPASDCKRDGRPTLFVKLGYRELTDGENDPDALISYVEKKSTKLRLTNVQGAGIFVFKVPKDHEVFHRPCRAAEASLKTVLLHSEDISVTPSGHRGEIGTFSASLEYMLVRNVSKEPGTTTPIAALAKTLRWFSGDPSLSPWSARAAGNFQRVGPKRLCPWDGPLPSPPDVQAEMLEDDGVHVNRAKFHPSLRSRAKAQSSTFDEC